MTRTSTVSGSEYHSTLCQKVDLSLPNTLHFVSPIAILEVNDEASPTEIKKAFLEMAKKYHPDRNSSAEAKEKFAEVNEAYETLGDDQKRNIYDATGMSSND